MSLDRVNLGPLTTVFSAPVACSTAIFQDSKLGWRNQICQDDGKSITNNKECFPAKESRGFYSPGLYCPEGYTTGCTASANDGVTSTGWKADYPLKDGETAVGCCPTGFRCGDLGTDGQTCVLRWGTLSMEQPTAKCKNGELTDFGTMTFPSQKPNLFAGMIQINWMASDKDESSTITTTTTSAKKTTTTASNSDSTSVSASASASASASRSDPDLLTVTRTVSGSLTTETLDNTAEKIAGDKQEDTDKPAMTKGAVVGTVVGVMVFVLFFPIGWLFRRNKQKKDAAGASPEDGDDSDSAADPTRSLVGGVGMAAAKAPGSSASSGKPHPSYADYPVHEIPGDQGRYAAGVYSLSQLEDTKLKAEMPITHEIHEVHAPGANTTTELPSKSEIYEVHVPGARTTPEMPTEQPAYEVAGNLPKSPVHHSVNDAPWSPVDPFEVSATPVDPNRPGFGAPGGK